MRPRARKLALTAHIGASVGWFGAVLTFLGLAVVGVTADDDRLVRGAYLVAEPVVRYVIVPFAVASLLTGLISSLGSAWGLVRHHWVLFKLVLNVFATLVLLIYTQTVGRLADIAGDAAADLGPLRSPTFLLHSAGALVLLVVAFGAGGVQTAWGDRVRPVSVTRGPGAASPPAHREPPRR